MVQHGTNRQKLLVKGIKQGLTTPKAMKLAGYSEYSSRHQIVSRKTRDLIHQAQDDFVNDYFKESRKLHFDTKYTARRLFKVAKGNDDFNAIQAIKEHHRIIMRTSDQHGPITNNSVFILPMTAPSQNWNENVNQSKVVDVQTVESDTNQAQTEPPPSTEQATMNLSPDDK